MRRSVTDRVVDERGAARSKARLRPLPASVGALVDQLLRLALDMEGELIAQVLLDALCVDYSIDRYSARTAVSG